LVVLLFMIGLTYPLVAGVGLAALWSVVPVLRVSSFLLYLLVPLLLALIVTTYLTHGARTTVPSSRRIADRGQEDEPHGEESETVHARARTRHD
jgi:hypothetical protein